MVRFSSLLWSLPSVALLSICAPAAADSPIRLQQSPSLMAGPRLMLGHGSPGLPPDAAEPSTIQAPRWLLAQGLAESQPATQPAGLSTEPKKKKRSKSEAIYGVGLTGRGLFVPFWFLEMFLDAGTALYSGAIGAEFIRRKRNFDLVASIHFNFYSPPDGNFLGSGKDKEDIDYIVFDKLNVLSFEVDFIWHHNFTDWLSLVYGAGLGFGIVLGDVLRSSAHGSRMRDGQCNTASAGDPSKCNPIDSDPRKNPDWQEEEAVWNRDPREWFDTYGKKCSGKDTPQDPCQFVEDDVWPVVPIVHLLVGLNFRVTNELNIRVTTGWHDAFYVGATTQWFFF